MGVDRIPMLVRHFEIVMHNKEQSRDFCCTEDALNTDGSLLRGYCASFALRARRLQVTFSPCPGPGIDRTSTIEMR